MKTGRQTSRRSPFCPPLATPCPWMKTNCMFLSYIMATDNICDVAYFFYSLFNIHQSAVLGLSCLLRVFRFHHTTVKLLVIPIGIWTFRSSALSFPGAKSPQMKLSFPWNFRSLEHSLPWSEKSMNFRSMELSHPYLKNYSNLSVGVFWQW